MIDEHQSHCANLSPAAVRKLKKRAHHLRPTIWVGQQGIHAGLLEELDQTLEVHELVKIKVNAADRAERDALIEQLTNQSGAQLIQRIGNMAVLFRPARKSPATAQESGPPQP